MAIERDLFLTILRHSLWGEGDFHYDNPSSDESDSLIGKVLKIAKDQALLGIVGDTILNHSTGVVIEKQRAIKLGYLILKIQTRHKMIETVIEDLSRQFSEKGIEFFILKGEGVGSLYPNPDLRQSGDIDIYIGKANYEEGKRILEAVKDPDKDFSESYKHYECHYKTISIEAHRVADKLKFRPKQDKYFQEITIEGIEKNFRTCHIGNADIKVPSAQFDVLFSLEHLWNHMIKGGVGLRQVCDWSMLLHSFNEQIDIQKLEKDLRACHLFDAWRYIAYIAVNYIGLPKNECPFYTDDCKIADTSEKLLNIIFNDGNFGKKNNKANEEGRPDNFVGSKFHSLKNNFRRLNMTVGYVEPIDRISYYLGYISESIDRLKD